MTLPVKAAWRCRYDVQWDAFIIRLDLPGVSVPIFGCADNRVEGSVKAVCTLMQKASKVLAEEVRHDAHS